MKFFRRQRYTAVVLSFACAFSFCSPLYAETTSVLNANEEQSSEAYDSWEEEKSAVIAVMLSIGITLVAPALGVYLDDVLREPGFGSALGMAGALIGPSVGQMYAGHHGKAWAHVGIRSGIAAATGATVVVLMVIGFGGGNITPLVFLAGGGAIAYAGITIWDIVDGAILCNEHNESLATNRRWSIQPTLLGGVNKKQENRLLPGLAFSASF